MSLTEMEETLNEPPLSGAPNRRKSKRRRFRWRWILLSLLVLGLASLLFLNGPGFRLIGPIAAGKFAESQGLTGSLQVEGSLWSGFSLKDVEFSPLDPNQSAPTSAVPQLLSLKLGEAAISYHPWTLIRSASELNWLDRVHLESLDLELQLPEITESNKIEPEESNSVDSVVRTDFHPLWNLLDTEIEIENVSVAVAQGDKKYRIKGFGLESIPGKVGQLVLESALLPDQEPVSDIAVRFQKQSHSLCIGPVGLGTVGELQTLTIAEPSPTVFTVGVEALVAGGELVFSLNEDRIVEASLREGTAIDLEKLFPDRREEFPMEGRIETMGLRFANPFEAPSRWEIEGRIVGTGLGWQDKTIDSTILTIQQNILNLEARRPDAVLKAEVSVPLSGASSTEDLANLPIDFQVSGNVPDLATLLAGLDVDLPLLGSLTLEAQNLQLDTTGNLNTGNILLQTEGLTWDGLAIPRCELAAIVETPNQLKLASDVRLDDETGLRLTGSWDQKEQNYTAEAKGTLLADGALGDWLSQSKDIVLAGNGDLLWAGAGSLKSAHHQGKASLVLRDLRLDESKPLETSLALSYEDTRAQIETLRVQAGDLTLDGDGEWDGKIISLPRWKLRDLSRELMTLQAKVPFDPKSEQDFLQQAEALHVQFDLDRLDLNSLLGLVTEEPPVEGIVSGTLSVSGSFRDLIARGDFSFFPTLEQVEDSQVLAKLEFDGDVNIPRTWIAKVDAEVSGLKLKEVELGTIDLALHTERTDTGNVLLGGLHFDHAGTVLDSKLQVDLSDAESLDTLPGLPIDGEAQISIESLGVLLRDFAPENLAGFPLDGSLTAEFSKFRLKDKSLLAGMATIHSETLTIESHVFDEIKIDASVDRPDTLNTDLVAALDSRSELRGTLGFDLKEQSYQGNLSAKADIAGEGKLRSLLSKRNIAKMLPETTGLEWKGAGNLNEEQHRGDLSLDAKSLSLADGSVPINLNLAGSYSENSANFPEIELRSKVLDLDGSLNWDGARLLLSDWKGASSGQRFLSLDASVPLTPESLGPQWFDQEDNLQLDLKIDELPIDLLSRLAMKESPLEGTLDVELTAAGTPRNPSLSGEIGLSQIFLPNDKGDIALGKLGLTLNAASEKANVSGRFQHPDLNPLSISAALPFHPGAWAQGERAFVDESVSVTAKMEKSSLAFLAIQIPEIESIEGTVGINAQLSGSLSKPAISGDGILEVGRLRLGDRNAPSLYDIDLSTRFAGNRVTIDRLHAIVAGGEVSGKGSILFEPESEPKFDFQITGREVLLFRNPDVSLRTDADLTLAGPWSRARIAGEVGITNSRFFKNFDLLPRTLPTRNTSVLPTVESGPSGGRAADTNLDLGVKVEPFRDWPVDVRIYTKNPFLVRSNLVESDLAADIHIGRTLGAPVPRGYLAIAEGEMSLPFSSIDVETGRVEFDENTGFNGAVEFKAKAKADKYRINVYLYNRVLDPKYVLTSVPPMPTEDLISLLISGVPREDLVGEGAGTMAASKAAMLLFKNMRKANAAADREPNLLDNLQERTELEIGRINAETGEQTIGGKIRLWKQLFFVGDVDAQNDYRAVLKYVFRFR